MRFLIFFVSACFAQQILEAFWLHDTETFSSVPIRDVINYNYSDGKPHIDILTVSCVKFSGSPYNFNAPYFNMSWLDAITSDDIAFIKSYGIKVILSVVGNYEYLGGNGWGCIPLEKNKEFALWVKDYIIGEWGFDGIDIDDEYYSCDYNTTLFINTISVLREVLGPSIIIKKDLYGDQELIPYIKDIIDYGSTMEYSRAFPDLVELAMGYMFYGLKQEQILIGVQAGPSFGGNTNLETVKLISQWPKKGGIMLFSFSQDTQEFTHWPQHERNYPDSSDHKWQKTIVKYLRN